ncbi:hypothetical protein C8J57DRAFT_1436665 [Mycena rebaudengoi]|nr:hypothetical protein C8J57DRAFT_1436665 [Mycena rebaudengoi]
MSSVPSNTRILICSAGGTGKTQLTRFYVEQYHRQILVDGEVSPLEVLDTAGSEYFSDLPDLTQKSSLKEAETLRNQIYRIKGPGSLVPIVAVGLKSDLSCEREVDAASAKLKWHVDDVFEDLVRQLRH